MTEPHQPVSEEELHRYVDGRLGDERREEVARALAANPALRQRVEDWKIQAEGLRRALLADESLDRDLILARLGAARGRPSPNRRWAVAAGVALALAVGAGGGWIARGDRNPTEIARLGVEAATAYRTFANDPSRPVEITSDNRAELVGWMAEKLGRRIALPDLAPLGYQLMGGRVLTAMYGPAAMLLYRDAADNRITVYVQPMRIGAPAEMRPLDAQTVEGYAWIERQVGYTVMSDGDRRRLHSIADQVKAETQS